LTSRTSSVLLSILSFAFGGLIGASVAGSLLVSGQPTAKALLDGLQAGLTPVIGLLATLIAYRQWRNDALRIKLDLFERRHAIYKALMSFLETVFREGQPELEELRRFYRDTSDAYFLCGSTVASYLQQVYKRSVSLRHFEKAAYAARDAGNPDEASRLYDKAGTELKWLNEQLEAAKDVFADVLLLHGSNR